jgi:flagellar motor switch protein FliG
MVRILKTSSVKKEVLNELQRSLKIEFTEEMERSGRGSDPHKVLAEIFNALDRQTEEHFMGVLETTVPEAAERIKALMFTFDDLNRLDRAGIQRVIREVDKSLLAMALKGVADAVKDLFFSNMSERAGKLLREDIAALGSVRLRDVEEAQVQIMMIVKQMVQTGELLLSETSEADELIV